MQGDLTSFEIGPCLSRLTSLCSAHACLRSRLTCMHARLHLVWSHLCLSFHGNSRSTAGMAARAAVYAFLWHSAQHSSTRRKDDHQPTRGSAVRAATAIPWSRLHDCITVPHTHLASRACAAVQIQRKHRVRYALPEKYRESARGSHSTLHRRWQALCRTL
jgi:hypothetical protein